MLTRAHRSQTSTDNGDNGPSGQKQGAPHYQTQHHGSHIEPRQYRSFLTRNFFSGLFRTGSRTLKTNSCQPCSPHGCGITSHGVASSAMHQRTLTENDLPLSSSGPQGFSRPRINWRTLPRDPSVVNFHVALGNSKEGNGDWISEAYGRRARSEKPDGESAVSMPDVVNVDNMKSYILYESITHNIGQFPVPHWRESSPDGMFASIGSSIWGNGQQLRGRIRVAKTLSSDLKMRETLQGQHWDFPSLAPFASCSI